jgi:hypothetical protein
MTHQRDGDRHAFACDECPETFEGEPGDDFAEAWAAARAVGWLAFQVKGEWGHRCPTCREGNADSRSPARSRLTGTPPDVGED